MFLVPAAKKLKDKSEAPPNVAALWLGSEILEFFKDWTSFILGVWAAPGAPETLAKGGGLRPPPF